MKNKTRLDRCVIYVQDITGKGAGDFMIFGVFNSYDKADSKLESVRKLYPDDNRWFVGIRAINPIPKARW